ncbi:aldo/keto reductase [Marinilabiliaceae bacterium JC017]|nr:aldo/keto reductase [Marinilabiliaceae bacterium JC017]
MRKDIFRNLGHSGISVSPMGMGCWAIGGPFKIGHWKEEIPFPNATKAPVGWGKVRDHISINAIHAAIYHGINFFDTADVYGAGHAEIILGKAIKDRRQELVIATKFGFEFDEKNREWTGINGSTQYIREAIEGSLRRLQTDYIDLYQLHIPEYPLEEALQIRDALDWLVAEGKIKAYAWSTDNTECARLFSQNRNCAAIQQALNVFSGNMDILDLCEDKGLASINRSPLAMGLLTGKFTTKSKFPKNDVRQNVMGLFEWFTTNGHPKKEFIDKLDQMRDVLTSNGRTLSQGAISFLWGLSPVTIPIPGFKTVKQVEENCKAMIFGPLTPNEVMELEMLAGHKHHEIHHHQSP